MVRMVLPLLHVFIDWFLHPSLFTGRKCGWTLETTLDMQVLTHIKLYQSLRVLPCSFGWLTPVDQPDLQNAPLTPAPTQGPSSRQLSQQLIPI